MPTSLALLRGVNVGGRNILPMKALAEMFVESGCSDVRTYIQSGNVVFKAPANLLKNLPDAITKQISDQFEFQVPVLIRTAEEIAAAIRNNPYLPNDEFKTPHVIFLADAPHADAVAKLDPARSLPDEFTVRGREIYLQLPNGAAKTKLTNAYFDSKLATVSTSRNWTTVLKMAEWMGIAEFQK